MSSIASCSKANCSSRANSSSILSCSNGSLWVEREGGEIEGGGGRVARNLWASDDDDDDVDDDVDDVDDVDDEDDGGGGGVDGEGDGDDVEIDERDRDEHETGDDTGDGKGGETIGGNGDVDDDEDDDMGKGGRVGVCWSGVGCSEGGNHCEK